MSYMSAAHQSLQQGLHFYPFFNPVVGGSNSMPPIYPLQHQHQQSPYMVPTQITSPSQSHMNSYPVSPHQVAYNGNGNYWANAFYPQTSRDSTERTSSVCSSSLTDKSMIQSSCDDERGKQNCNLIVNYLPAEMTEMEFGRMFAALGPIESVKLVCDPITHNSLGYGFIKFFDPGSAAKAIQTLNGLRICNKEIKVSVARPSCKEIKDANLYVSNLPSWVETSDHLEQLFSPYGTIVSTRLLLNQNLKPRGVGFVRFNLHQEAEMAMKTLNRVILENCTAPLTIRFAKRSHALMAEGTHFANFAPRRQPGIVLQVNFLDPTIHEIELHNIFGQFGHVLDISIIRSRWNTRKSYALVTMQDVASASAAINYLNGSFVGSKKVRITLSEDHIGKKGRY
ncbi:ELAV-like protein 3 [Neocloeon triangulifer]|uniref:ELAV-like protein 3 n=1 Tax=Neocloeon triangulifer TaxID=2078957 RepID=UPI00286EFC0A|nr:ELAV-like protein 3 [Neocloeon triangulifer]